MKLVAAAVSFGLAVTMTSATAMSHDTVICHRLATSPVAEKGYALRVRNDWWLTPGCIQLHASGFRVVTRYPEMNGRVDAYPSTFYGNTYGLETSGSILPRKLGSLPRITSTWRFSGERAHGLFNASYDIWGSYSRTNTGHPDAFEIMVWLYHRGFRTPSGTPVVMIRHIRYYLMYWTTSYRGHIWPYVSFRQVRETAHTGITVTAFLWYARQHGLIPARCYLVNITTGFEIVSGGYGLSSDRMTVTVVRHRKTQLHKISRPVVRLPA